MSKQEEAGLILKLYELRREEKMRQARDWFFRDFNPETLADFNNAPVIAANARNKGAREQPCRAGPSSAPVSAAPRRADRGRGT